MLEDFLAMLLQALAENAHLAGGRRNQPEDHVDGGRLAGAVRTQQADDFTGTHFERHVFHRDKFSENFGQMIDFYQHDFLPSLGCGYAK